MKYLSISIRVALLALGQSLDCHSASEVSLMDMENQSMYNHNKAQQSKNRVHISWDILYFVNSYHVYYRITCWQSVQCYWIIVHKASSRALMWHVFFECLGLNETLCLALIGAEGLSFKLCISRFLCILLQILSCTVPTFFRQYDTHDFRVWESVCF